MHSNTNNVNNSENSSTKATHNATKPTTVQQLPISNVTILATENGQWLSTIIKLSNDLTLRDTRRDRQTDTQ